MNVADQVILNAAEVIAERGIEQVTRRAVGGVKAITDEVAGTLGGIEVLFVDVDVFLTALTTLVEVLGVTRSPIVSGPQASDEVFVALLEAHGHLNLHQEILIVVVPVNASAAGSVPIFGFKTKFCFEIVNFSLEIVVVQSLNIEEN